jgi:hypothetical protein
MEGRSSYADILRNFHGYMLTDVGTNFLLLFPNLHSRSRNIYRYAGGFFASEVSGGRSKTLPVKCGRPATRTFALRLRCIKVPQ